MAYQQLNQSKIGKKTILSIEDNADEWFIIRWTLVQLFPGANLVWQSDASQAKDYLAACLQPEKSLPDLILVDLYLPTPEAGLEILEALKSQPVYQQIPTVVLSRSSDQNDITDTFDRSANSYIIKPTTYKEWVEGLVMLRTYWADSCVS
ncbi:response regulator [Spirosoma luteum]|uniref:response regulator n=1 Tax=Spirosoma luteum TaxID=431553 RepID=UPI0003750E2D|nr:response regulator [Spirosoma luteum]